MPSRAFLGLGSNLGDRIALLARAVSLLHEGPVYVERVSSVYESKPVGPIPEQPDFLNSAAVVSTTLTPADLLRTCQSVEQRLGRIRAQAQGPRLIDIDLLLFAGEVVASDALNLPHPRLLERAFVLKPLLELDAALCDPVSGQPLQGFLDAIGASQPLRYVSAFPEWHS